MTMLSFKQVESTANEVVVGLLSFLTAWISDIVNMLLLFIQFKLKMAVHASCKKENIWTTFGTFLRVNFILKFFQELPSLLSVGKLKSKKKSLLMGILNLAN